MSLRTVLSRVPRIARTLVRSAAAFAAVALAIPCSGQGAEPLRIRNLNPLVAVFGLPSWDVIDSGSRFDATLELANHYRFSAAGGEQLVLNGETLRTTVSFTHAFGEGWSAGIDWPLYRLSGGVLDDAIDGWHSTFQLPDGGRNARPDGQLLFVLADRAGPFLTIEPAVSGCGDAQLKIAHDVGGGRFVAQASLKLPTGDPDLLLGSGSTDVAFTLLRSQALSGPTRPAGYYWGVGLMYVGRPERIDYDANRWAYTGIVGGTLQRWPRAGLKAQLDFHSAFYDSPLEEIGSGAIEATIGAWVERGKTELEFAIVEDLEVSTAPDVVVQVAAHWRW
jgi:hypothetical protein